MVVVFQLFDDDDDCEMTQIQQQPTTNDKNEQKIQKNSLERNDFSLLQMRKKTDEFFMNECGKTKQKNKKLSYDIHHTQFEQNKNKYPKK